MTLATTAHANEQAAKYAAPLDFVHRTNKETTAVTMILDYHARAQEAKSALEGDAIRKCTLTLSRNSAQSRLKVIAAMGGVATESKRDLEMQIYKARASPVIVGNY